MLLRHKIPTIFNIYMLDVICCALGCVVLLWQVAHQEAEMQTAEATQRAAEAKQRAADLERARQAYEKTREDYEKTDDRLQARLKEVLELQARLQALSRSLASTEKERDVAQKLAADRQDTVNKTARALDISKEALKKLQEDLAQWVAAHEKVSKELTEKNKISTELLAKLVLANTQIDSLKKDANLRLIDLTRAQKKADEQTVLLKVSQDDAARLQKLLDLAKTQIDVLRKDADLRLIDLNATKKKVDEQAALLKISEADASKLQKLLDSLRDESKSTQTKLKLTELTLKVREEDLARAKKDLALVLTTRESLEKQLLSTTKDRTETQKQIGGLILERDRLKDQLFARSTELASANSTLGSLRLDKDKLSKRVASLEADLEQRFAGIPLTGENVVFLIDISGSMVMSDENTNDPDKWPFLCETLMKLMKSIPTLQRFQVILFSEKTTHLFGNRDHWLKYEGASSAKSVRDALLKVKVEGGTNMHDGFEEAFRYRKLKLDTIYLFSDGLPNIGPGVPSSLVRATEAEKNLLMAKYIRDKLKKDWNAPDSKLAEAVRINAVGFYFESPDVGAFLWALAREHKGNFVGLR